MGTGSKLGLVAGLIVVVAIGFFVLQPGETSEQQDDPPARAGQTQDAGSGDAKKKQAQEPTATVRSAPEPPPAEIELRGNQVVGKPQTIKVASGERIRFVARSDVEDSVHLHGYDIEKPVAPGKPARFDVKADIEGQFEIESHFAEDAGKEALLATLIVEP